MLEAPKTPSGASSGSLKRRLETEEKSSKKESKKKKKTETEEKSSKKETEKKCSNRVWPAEDEITILKALVAFRRRGKDLSHLNDLYNSVKHRLINPNHTKKHFHHKICTIKNKYDNTLKRVGINGEDPEFSNPHDAEVYKLSKKVWAGSKKLTAEERKEQRRVWSDEDEIILLEGMVNLKKRGKDIYPVNELFDSIKDLLGPNIGSKKQVEGKIKTLKHSYYKNLKDVGFSGADPWFARPHHAKLYQLSKEVWGQEGVKDSKHEPVAEELGDLPIPPLGWGEFFRKAGWNFMGASTAARLDKQWKNLVIAEAKAQLKRIDLIKEQTQAMLDVLKSTDL